MIDLVDVGPVLVAFIDEHGDVCFRTEPRLVAPPGWRATPRNRRLPESGADLSKRASENLPPRFQEPYM